MRKTTYAIIMVFAITIVLTATYILLRLGYFRTADEIKTLVTATTQYDILVWTDTI
jgi:hypothetical protein